MHRILEHHEIGSDLLERCRNLHTRYTQIFGPDSQFSAAGVTGIATMYAAQLAEPGGHSAAALIMTYLVDEAERRGTAFWSTPLGRACGWWTGAGQLEPTDDQGVEVSTPTARVAGLLGVTRQSVHEAVAKGKLRKNSLTGVRPEDVRREMQSRWPMGA